mmetsp:Transcript_6977/g.27439  ORF Transcript_6977/g.27439 Transcript_6977/m.27439 type:complete len:288 (+) Transcript_6977:250-1113(+)
MRDRVRRVAKGGGSGDAQGLDVRVRRVAGSNPERVERRRLLSRVRALEGGARSGGAHGRGGRAPEGEVRAGAPGRGGGARVAARRAPANATGVVVAASVLAGDVRDVSLLTPTLIMIKRSLQRKALRHLVRLRSARRRHVHPVHHDGRVRHVRVHHLLPGDGVFSSTVFRSRRTHPPLAEPARDRLRRRLHLVRVGRHVRVEHEEQHVVRIPFAEVPVGSVHLKHRERRVRRGALRGDRDDPFRRRAPRPRRRVDPPAVRGRDRRRFIFLPDVPHRRFLFRKTRRRL